MPVTTYPGVYMAENGDTFYTTTTNNSIYIGPLHQTYYPGAIWTNVLPDYATFTIGNETTIPAKPVPLKHWRDEDREPTEEDRVAFMRLLNE